MNPLAEALLLMHTAHQRYVRLRATVRDWRRTEPSARAFDRHVRRSRGTGYAAITLAGAEEPPDVVESTLRLWFERPDRIREEWEGADETSIGVQVGEQWWMYTPVMGAQTNEGAPDYRSGVGQRAALLLDPSPLASELELESIGRERIAGRDGTVLRGRPRASELYDDMRSGFALGSLAYGADVYELAVDAEFGVLLRVSASLEGERFYLREVVEIGFDETFAPDVFVFRPPPGEQVRSIEERPRTEPVAIEEAARRAPFTVFIPARVPPGWTMRVFFHDASDRPPIPVAVSIHYSAEDATHHVALHQTAVGEAYADDLEWHEREVDGERLLVFDPGTSARLPARVRVERDGTRIDLSGDLGLDALLALARSLRPASSEPPDIDGERR